MSKRTLPAIPADISHLTDMIGDWSNHTEHESRARFEEAQTLHTELVATYNELVGVNPSDVLADERRWMDKANRTILALNRVLADGTRVDRTGVVRPDGSPRGTSYAEGRPLAAGQTFTGYAQARGLVAEDQADLDLDKYLRGMATGQWRGAEREYQAAMVEGTGANGGFLLPTVLSAQLIDMTRNATRVLQAGATIVPMENRTLDVPKWTGDPTAAWHSENAAISPSDPTIGKVTLTAQALASYVNVSWELIEDAPGVQGMLAQAFANVFALKLDMAALYGSGTPPEPRGVKTTSGVTITPLGANGAALTNFDPLIDAVGRLRDNNEEPTAQIMAGRTARVIAKFKDTQNQPLATPEYLSGVQRLDTKQVPTNLVVGTSGSTTSDVFTADWRQLLIGVRTELEIKVLRERNADTGTAGFIAWARYDTAVARTSAFDVLTGVL